MQFQKDKYKKRDKPKKVYIQDNSPDSDNGEFINTDPNVNLSPMYDSQEQMGDSIEPSGDPQKTKLAFQPNRNDIKNNSDMAQLVSEQPIPSLVVNIPNRNAEDTFERSPKTINVGSSRDDYDYNVRSLNARKSPNNTLRHNYRDSNDDYMDQTPYDDDDYQAFQENPRAAILQRNRSPQATQVIREKALSPYGRRDRGGVIPINKMSPSQNYDDLNYSGEKGQDGQNQFSNLKNTLGNNRTTNRQYGPEQTQNTKTAGTNNQKDEAGNKYNKKTYNNMSYRDVKRIVNRFSKIYDPNRNTNGLLVEESQVTVPGAQDEVFNNRYKVLAKMNRLSNILLAKQRKRNSPERRGRNFNAKTFNRDNSYNPKSKKQFNRHTLAKSPESHGSRKAISRSPDHKFLYVSLAMISSKGPSAEDRTILRRMRLDKGGVVDLAQEDPKKNKYKIKKAQRKQGNKRNLFTNPKYRDKAAKVIQSWWRDLKNVYNDRLNKIIKIQSVFRGRFVRKYMYDLFYLNFLYISFCKKIENVLSGHVRPIVWEKLFGKKEPPEDKDKTPTRERLLKHILKRDYRNDLETILPAWKKWLSNTRKLGVQNSKGRNLVQIRADKEKKLGDIRNAFNKWVFIKKILDAQDKLDKNKDENKKKDADNLADKERNLKKLKGFFQLMNGIDNLTKKEGMNETLPKIENYLKGQKGKDKLRKLLAKKPKYIKNILRKYLYKWYGNAINAMKNDRNREREDELDDMMKDLKRTVFRNILMKIQKKQEKNILRKYFFEWLKNTIKLMRKELEDKEKGYKNKEIQIIEEYEKKITTYENQKKDDEENIRKIKTTLNKLKKEKEDKEDELLKRLQESQDNKSKNLLNYLKGTQILQRFVWRKTHPDPLNALGNKIEEDELIKRFKKVVKIRHITENNLLRKYFDRWKTTALKGIDPSILYKLLAKLIEISSNNFKRKILAKKFNKWRRAAGVNPYDSLRKARDIFDFAELVKKIFKFNLGDEFLDRLDRTRNPERTKLKLIRIYKMKQKNNRNLLRNAFDKWRNIINKESVKILKSKLIYKIYDKNISGTDKELLNRYFQRWKNITFKDNIRKYKSDLFKIHSKHEDTKRLFVKTIFKGLDKRTNIDLLREYFNRWKKLTDLDRIWEYEERNQKIILSKIIGKRTNEDSMLLLQYLLRWRNIVWEMRAAEAHKPYRKRVIKILLTKNDKEELQRCFTRWKYGGLKRLPIMPYIVAKRFLKKVLIRKAYKEFVKKMTERNPKVLKTKGKELIKTLKDIKDNKSRDFLTKLIKLIQRKYLGKIIPKMHDKNRENYLRKYFDRWVENTLEDAKKKKEYLANWLKNKFVQDKINKENRIKELLTKFLKKLKRAQKLSLSYAFYKYRKNARLVQQIENAKIIQKFCRRVLDSVTKDKVEFQKEFADLLKYFYRRKVLKNIRDLADNSAPILRDGYNRKKYKFERMKKVITIIDRNRNKDILRKYWDRWKNNKGLYEDYALIIQKKVRQLISKKKLKLLRRLNEILFKLIMTNKDKEKDILRSRLLQWLTITKSLQCHDNAKIIQNFCRQKLNEYLKNKLARYFDKLAKKYTCYLINNVAKVDKLNKLFKRKPFNDVVDGLIKRALLKYVKETLIRIIYKYDDKNKKLLLRHYFEKWIKKTYQMLDKEYDAATKIQSTFKGYLFRKYFGMDEKILRLLKKIIEKLIMASNPKNYLRAALARWRKNVAKLACHENAKIIQKFCREIQDKILKNKNQQNLENYKNLARKLNKLRISPKEFFERLKKIRRIQNSEIIMDKLGDKRLKILKGAFDNIKDYPKYKFLDKILPISDDLKERLLRKYLKKWRNKAMRYKGIMEFLRSIINTFNNYKDNILRSNLYRWLYKARYLTQKEQARIISEFCKPISKLRKVLRNWHKLADGLRNKNRDEDIAEIYYKLRILKGLKKLKKPLVRNAGNTVFDKLNKNRYMKQFMYRIRPLFYKNDSYWNKRLLREYLDRWRNITKALIDRDNALNDMMDLLDKLRKKNDANTLADASLLKKFLHDYPLIRALGFLKKLKEFAKQRGKNENLAIDLIDAKKNLEPQKRNNLIKKLFKVYAYKVLNKLFETLEKIQQDNLEPLKKEFLDKLFNNLKRKAERSYNDSKRGVINPTKKQTSFRLKKPILLQSDQKKKLIYVSLLPSLFKYINNKILEQKQEGFDALKRERNAHKFCELYKKWAEKQELKPKKELVDKLRRIYRRAVTEGPLLLKLFKILRRESIRRILKHSKKTNKVLGMMYVTRMLVMQREIAKQRFLRQLIRRWRYIAFSKKLALNKMKTIYKNLHMTYLEISNSLFGDEGSHRDTSVIKEFERFGTSVGMWENEKPSEKSEEKYVKKIKTSYVFDPEEFEKFQNKYYPTEQKEEEYYEEEKKETKTKGYKVYYEPRKKNK